MTDKAPAKKAPAHPNPPDSEDIADIISRLQFYRTVTTALLTDWSSFSRDDLDLIGDFLRDEVLPHTAGELHTRAGNLLTLIAEEEADPQSSDA